MTLRAYIDPKAEFKQIFDEGWRNQRDYLYVPNMHGSDWPKMKEMYGTLLPFATGFFLCTLASLAVVLVVEKGRLFRPHGVKV